MGRIPNKFYEKETKVFASFKIIEGDFLKTDDSAVFYSKPCMFRAALHEDNFLLSEQIGDKQQKLSLIHI